MRVNRIIWRFCNDKIIIQGGSKNSIMPLPDEGYAYGYFFPSSWSPSYIQKLMDPSKKNIEEIKIVENKVGQSTGKILFKFKNEKIMNKYISKYNEDFIMADNQTYRVVIKGFHLKTEVEKRGVQEERKNLKHGVRLSNLNFDMTEKEVQKIGKDFGKVVFVDMSKRENGINRGFATVYFETKKQAGEFCNFADGLMYRDRKFKAYIPQPQTPKQKIQYLDNPIYIFKQNEELMKKLINKESSVI